MSFFAMITFVFVNLADLVLNHSRARASAGGFILYGAVPALGVGVDLFILVRSFFIEQWSQGVMRRSAIAFDIACALVALLALWPRSGRGLRRARRAGSGSAARS